MTSCFSGGFEAIPLCFIGCFAYLLPVAFAFFVIVYLVQIKSKLDKIESRLNNLERQNPE